NNWSYVTGEGSGVTWNGEILLEAPSGTYSHLALQGTLTIQGTITDIGGGHAYLINYGNVTLNRAVEADSFQNQFGNLTLNDVVGVRYLYNYNGNLFVNANTTVG
ncbi:MAG: hypothetical protein ACK55I_51065, partial [bacterium]